MWSNKKIRVEIINMEGMFYNDKNNLIFEDMPIDLNITKTSLPANYKCTVNIFGASKTKMDMVTTLKWRESKITQKAIRVFVNEGKGYSLIFDGAIQYAAPVYDSVPETAIRIEASAGAYTNLMIVPPYTLKGEVPVANVVRDICNTYNVQFENHGVDITCKNPRIETAGLSNRLNEIAKTYKINIVYGNNRVDIYPEGKTGKKWNLTKDTYIGYPSFTATGIKLSCDTVFSISPSEAFIISGSEIPYANDSWYVIQVTYNLSTKIGGKWTMTLEGVRYIDE